jgi:hypothetical protein
MAGIANQAHGDDCRRARYPRCEMNVLVAYATKNGATELPVAVFAIGPR